MAEGWNVLMRWLHIAGVACLGGGMLYAWLASRAAAALAPQTRDELGERAAAAFRPVVLLSIGGLAVSGVYNLLSNPGHSPRYLVFLFVKLLLVAHIFAVAVLSTQPHHPRRARLMAGGAISTFIVIGIAAYLRRIF